MEAALLDALGAERAFRTGGLLVDGVNGERSLSGTLWTEGESRGIEGNEIMQSRNVFGLFLALLAPWTGVAMGTQPDSFASQPVIVETEPPPVPVAEAPVGTPEYACEDVDERNALVRWWQDRFKPLMQYTHWGYPEYFEEMPFGTAVRSHHMVQVSKGWAARCVLYQYDFCDDDVMLNPPGERRLRELAAAFSCWLHYPLLIEATPERPGLATARRNHVAQLLHDHHIPARVEVDVPSGFMPFGEEALLINRNLLRQVNSGGGTMGMPGGAGAAAGAGAGSTAPPNTGAQ
jgi:hypothetical protein